MRLESHGWESFGLVSANQNQHENMSYSRYQSMGTSSLDKEEGGMGRGEKVQREGGEGREGGRRMRVTVFQNLKEKESKFSCSFYCRGL